MIPFACCTGEEAEFMVVGAGKGDVVCMGVIGTSRCGEVFR